MKKSVLFSTLIFCATFGLGLVSCEVGLGEAVDTQPPKLEISYPKTDAVIRDWFYLSGKCDDETGIKSVTVTFNETGSSSKNQVTYGPYSAVVDGKTGTWKCKVNELDEQNNYPIPDGSYEVSILATDNGTRTTTVKKTLSIDNTAPILIIQTPKSTVSDTSPTVFGETLKITGSALDINDIDNFTISVFNGTTGEFIASSTSTAISKSMEVTLGIYGDTEDSSNFYTTLYGTKDGSGAVEQKNYKYKVSMSDEARKYQDEDGVKRDDSSETGNVTTGYYLRADKNFNINIIQKISSGIFVNSSGEPVKSIDALYRYKNKSYSVKKSYKDTVDKYLEECFISSDEDSQPVGTFALKPNNNPYFTVGALSSFDSAKGWTSFEKGSSEKLIINVVKGLSEESLETDSYAVHLQLVPEKYLADLKKDLSDFQKYPDVETIKLLEAYNNENNEGVNKASWTRDELAARNSMISSGASSDTITIPMEGLITAKCYYKILVYGHDQTGSDIDIGTDVFAFRVTASALAPKLVVTEPSESILYSKGNVAGSLNFAGNLTTQSGDTNFAVKICPVTYDSRSGSEIVMDPIANAAFGEIVNGKANWNCSIDLMNSYFDKTQSADYTLRVIASDQGGGSDAIKDFTVHYDVEGPSIEFNSVVPVVEYDSTEQGFETNTGYVNGIISISGSITDSVALPATGAEIGIMTISNGSSVKPITITRGSFSETFNTNGFDGELTISLEAKDRAGNVSVKEYKYSYDAVEGGATVTKYKNLIVNQETDRPVITLNNADASVKTVGGINLSTNLFGTASNNKLNFTVSDDDGINGIYVVVKDASGAETVSENLNTKSNYPTTASVNYKLPETEGVYTVEVRVCDKNYAEYKKDVAAGEGVQAVKYYGCSSSGQFVVAVDAGAPSITIKGGKGASAAPTDSFNASGCYAGASSGYVISGTASDGCGYVTVKRYAARDTANYGSKENPVSITVAADGSWSDSFTTTTNGDTFYYVAEDKYKNSTTSSFQYMIDSVNPVVSIAAKIGATVYIDSTLIYSFSGTAEDPSFVVKNGENVPVDHSDVASVQYALLDASSNVIATGTANNTVSWTANVSFKNPDTGAPYAGVKGIKFWAVDNGGLVSEAESREIILDAAAPVFSNIKVKDGSGNELTNYDDVFYTNTSFKISGKVTDDNLKSLKCGANEISVAQDGTFEHTVTVSAETPDDRKTYVLTATDKAEQASTANVVVVIDKTKPRNSVNVEKLLNVKIGETLRDDVVNGIITISGSASDANSVISTAWEIRNASDAVVKSGTFSSPSSLSETVNTAEKNSGVAVFADGAYKLYFISTDRAKNVFTSAGKSIYIDQNSDKPVITPGNYSVAVTASNSITDGETNIFATGKNLNATISDDDGIKSVKVGKRAEGSAGDYEYTTLLSNGSSTSYTVNYTLPAVEGSYELKIEVEDIVGNLTTSSVSSTFVVVIDDAPPVFSNMNPSSAVWTNSSIGVTGTVSDTSGKITIVASGTGASANYGSAVTVNSASVSLSDTISVADNGITSSNTELYTTYTATDKWGRSATQKVYYKKDTVKPAFVLADMQISSKNLYSGENLVENVWFKSESLSVSGKLSEEHSGISNIYYWLQKPADASPDTTDVNTAHGSFSATRNGSNSSFRTTIDGFVVGNNTIYLVAEDNAGNISGAFSYIAKVDMEVPTMSRVGESSILSNGIASKSVNGTYSDVGSGVKTGTGVDSITIKVGEQTAVNATVNADGTWSAVIGTAAGTITGKIKDIAGNSATVSLGSVVVDSTCPVVNFSESILNKLSGINGKQSISGSVTESDPASLDIYYSATGTVTDPSVENSGWTKLFSTTTASTIYNWTTDKIDFDTASGAKTKTDGKSKLYVLAVAYDKAGNCNIHKTSGTDQQSVDFTASSNMSSVMKEFIVDMNGDRPVIKMSEITDVSSTVRKYVTSINGLISDDDGIEEFYISPDAMADEAAWNTYIAAYKQRSGWNSSKKQDASVLEWTSNGSFSYTPVNGDDGTKSLYFYVKDKEGAVFFTGNTATPDGVYRPYINYKGAATNSDNDSVINYSTDSNPPVFTTIGYVSKDTADNAGAVAAADYEVINGTQISVGGASSKFVKFRAEATDESGIKSVKASIKNSSSAEVKSLTFTRNGATDYYLSEAFDVEGQASGNYTMTVTVTDKSDLTSVKTLGLVVNNMAPGITITSPSASQLQTGVITITGTTSSTYSSINKLYYLVMKNSYDGKSDEYLISEMKKQTQVNGYNSKASFQFVFDGESNPLFPTTTISDYSNFTSDDQVYNIPVYFYAEDMLGNSLLYKGFKVYYNPYSDRPTATISYPADGQLLSGTINVSGYAKDDNGGGTPGTVTATYIQIDVDNDGDFDANDKALLTTKGYTVKDTTNVSGTFDADPDFWGIEAGDANIAIALNAANQLEIAGTNSYKKTDSGYEKASDGTVYKFRIRAAAFDNNGLLGNWSSPVSITIDPNAPNFGVSKKAYVAQFSGATETAHKAYSSSLCLKDEWYLLVSVEHSGGVKELSYVVSERGENGTYIGKANGTIVSNSTVSLTDNIAETIGETGYVVKIPLGTGTGSGVKRLKLTATSKGNVPSEVNYDYTFDNVAPEISELTYNSDYEFKENSILKNSDSNVVSVGSKVTDGTAGVDKVLFYFYRETEKNGKTYTRLFDPMRDKSADTGVLSGMAGVDVLVDGAASTTGVSSEEIVAGYKLFGRSDTVGRSSTTTMTLSAADPHVRAGGLVKIAGGWHRIKSVSGTTVTLEDSDEIATSYTAAFFPYAQVVDNTGSERVKSYTAEPFIFSNNTDDGDGMPESIQGVSSLERTWNATFHGHFIPDGPVTFVVFAFDKAENISATKVSGSMQNNRPRLAKVHLGTDLNGDGKWTANEYETYSMYNVEGTSQEIYELTTKNYKESANQIKTRKSFTIKDKLAVAAEFVNGNGAIGMVFSNDDSGTTKNGEEEYIEKGTKGTGAREAQEYDWIDAATGDENVPDFGSNGFNFSTNMYNYIISKDMLKANGTGTEYGDTAANETRAMNFTFWDSTEGTTQGKKASQYCFLRVKDFIVDQVDETLPTVEVTPFHWTSVKDNSIYGSESANYVKDLQGHIELGSEAVNPKVSGKIVFTGYAYDDVRLSKILVNYGNILSNAELASYTAAAGWTVSTATMGTNHYTFSISDAAADGAFFNQDGHKVKWTFCVDTAEAIDKVADNGVTLAVIAHDASDVKNDGNKNDGKMTVDIVPYITEVKTRLSNLDSSNPTAYSRTALGYYPVSENEVISIEGFNIGRPSGNTVVKIGDAEISGITVESKSKIYGINVGSNSSGKLTVAVEGVTNINDTDSDTAAYNIIDNGANNAKLNDDVQIKVWEFKTIAEPVAVEHIMYPTVKMSPKDGRIGASFSNSYYFHMAGYGNNDSTWYSHTPFLCGYDGSDANSFTFDKNGYTYGGAQYRASDLPSEGGSFNFVFSTAKPESDMSLADVYRCNTGSARLENNCANLRKTPTTDRTEWAYNKWRVKSPQFVAVANDDSTAVTVYSAYYDSSTKQIRYRKGVVNAAGIVGNNVGFVDNQGDRTSIGDYMMLGTNDSLKDVWHTSAQATTGGYADTPKGYPNGQDAGSNGYDQNRNGNFGARSIYAPDSLQTQNNQVVHVLGSNGVVSDDSETTITNTYEFYEWYNKDASPQYLYTSEAPDGWNNTHMYSDKQLTQEVAWGQAQNSTTRMGRIKRENNEDDWNSKTIYERQGDKKSENISVTLSKAIQGIYKKTDSANNHTYAHGAGKYVALGVLSTGKAVIAWYDDTAKHLLVAVEPTFEGSALNPNAGDNFANSYARTNAWENATIDLGSGGEYVQLVVDSGDNIHIAHYDSSVGGELKYVKLSADKTIIEQVSIDSYDDVGSHLTLNVGKDSSGNQIPYIGYYGRKRAKMAYKVDSSIKAGVDGKFFTHGWEVTYVPTSDSIDESAENTVNVAVWTDNDGYLKKSAYAANTTASLSVNTGAAGDTVPRGQIYANSTNNPIVAYVSSSGSLDYAQIKGDSTEVTFKTE